jgi:hypothetical protein
MGFYMHFEEVRTLLDKVIRQAEDLWIEREALKDLIAASNITLPDKIEEIYRQAKASPEYRERAKEVFAETWSGLEKVSKTAFIQAALEDGLPPNDEQN